MKIRLKIQDDQDRDSVVVALENSGYDVHVEEEINRGVFFAKIEFFVCLNCEVEGG